MEKGFGIAKIMPESIMEKYKNLEKNSGVLEYEILDEGIKIKFAGDHLYLYDYVHPGREPVEQMKKLAKKGRGLATFISTQVREDYAEKYY